MKLVHAADLHLDSRLLGLSRYPGAPEKRLRGASRHALENLVELCVRERAALLLLAGDLYDGDWRDYSTGLFFVAQLAQLRDAGVRVAMIRGNHDAASQITKHLRLPDNVRELSASAAETLAYDDLGIVVHGQSFATRVVTENLAQSYPERVTGMLNIGLLHTSVNGREGHEPYAPCTIADLSAKGYDYWALGHVHQREVLGQSPWIVFPGNLQGRHVREAGEKGATVIDYTASGIRSVTHHALDVVRYARVRVDASRASDLDAVLDSARDALSLELGRADGRMLASRVEIVGESPAHLTLHRDADALTENVRALGTELGAGELWVEKVVIATRPALDVVALRNGDGVLSQLLRAIDALRTDAGEQSTLLAYADELSALRSKLPAELREGVEGIALQDPAYLAAQLDAIEPLLLSHLLHKGAKR